MSFASEPPPAPGVLQHTAPRPAVFMPPHPSDEELAFNWTLSERDIDFILTNHRGPENLCRLAIQLCVVRQHGRFLAHYTHVSPSILDYLCRQLDLIPLVSLSSPVRSSTETDYQRDIAAYLGWRAFDAGSSRRAPRVDCRSGRSASLRRRPGGEGERPTSHASHHSSGSRRF